MNLVLKAPASEAVKDSICENNNEGSTRAFTVAVPTCSPFFTSPAVKAANK